MLATLEKVVIETCATTLANLKTGEIVNFKFEDLEQARKDVAVLNDSLAGKGVTLEILKERNDSLMLYVYRKNRLACDLACPKARSFLEQQGYNLDNIETIVPCLKTRVNATEEKTEFPHEIGLFLSYPVEDVMGFIENKGKNCSCCGYWKVYSEVEKALSMFRRFDKCRTVYRRLCSQGANINKLTVACNMQ